MKTMRTRSIEEIEKECRDIWTAKGVLKEKQDAILADAAMKAQPGTMVGPFMIPASITSEGAHNENHKA